jgi:hypothetical protein
MISSNNSVNNGFFPQQIILYIDHFRYSFIVCNGCLFWVLRTENHPVIMAEDIICTWDSLKTCELMEKLFLSYQCIRPWSNMEYCDGINNFSNSTACTGSSRCRRWLTSPCQRCCSLSGQHLVFLRKNPADPTGHLLATAAEGLPLHVWLRHLP